VVRVDEVAEGVTEVISEVAEDDDAVVVAIGSSNQAKVSKQIEQPTDPG